MKVNSEFYEALKKFETVADEFKTIIRAHVRNVDKDYVDVELHRTHLHKLEKSLLSLQQTIDNYVRRGT